MAKDRATNGSADVKAGVDRRAVVTIAGGVAATAAVGGVAWMETSGQSRPSRIVMMDAVQLSDAIKSKQVSSVEVMNAYLDHIERLNRKVNAIVALQDRDGLVAQAKERDEAL